MGDKTGIEWTDASWNPVVGCSITSPGCTNCYAMTMASRLASMANKPRWGKTNVGTDHYVGTTTRAANGKPVWTSHLNLAPDHTILAPLRWTRPRLVFVNSMGDLFHEDCPDEWIDRVFAIMSLARQHTFQILTKRATRMRDYFDDLEHRAMAIGSALGDMLDGDWIWREGRQFRDQIDGMISLAHGLAPDEQSYAREDFLPLPNVWLGVSTEDQKRANERLDQLAATPAAIRFVSYEPAIGPLDLSAWLAVHEVALRNAPHHWTERTGEVASIDWVICGGESGPDARPMHPEWARSVRDQCAAANVPFFFKQWGEWTTAKGQPGHLKVGHVFADGYQMVRLGKRGSGSRLDGITHKSMPGRTV